MKNVLIAAFVLGLFSVPTVMAATNEGDAYWTFSGMWEKVNYAEGDSDDTAEANLGVEYFLSKEFSMSLEGLGSWSDYVDAYGAGTRARYHFNTDSDMVPYVGAGFSYVYADSDDADIDGDGYVYGPLVGIKFFMNERTNLFVEYQYRLYGGDLDDVYDESSAIMFGLSFKWG